MGKKKKYVTRSSPQASDATLEHNATQKNTTLGQNSALSQSQSTSSFVAMETSGELISSPLVHASADLIPVELHNNILQYHQSLGIPVPSMIQSELLCSNLEGVGVSVPPGRKEGALMEGEEVSERIRSLATQLGETLV